MVNPVKDIDFLPEVCSRSAKAGANAKQVGGDHYKKYPIEPWDYNIANNLPFMEGSIISYVTRWRDKGGIADLKKSIHFLEKMIEAEEARIVRDKALQRTVE